MKRQLASIQRISDLQPIPNADVIEVASILGWKVVVKKGEFKVGDLCVYCEIDSVLPARPEFEFLAPKRYRIKTVKLRGQISQGIAFPLETFKDILADYRFNDKLNRLWEEGDDATEAVGVTKWEIPEVQIPGPGNKKDRRVGKSFPSYVIKTDEIRIQSIPHVLQELPGVPCYVTLKIDGTSGTFAHKDGKIDVCSRTVSRNDPQYDTLWEKIKKLWIKLRYKKTIIPPSCVYWDIARKYNLIEILKKTGNIAIQGEIAGPDIQQNKLQLKERQLFVFNVFDIDKQEYYPFEKFKKFCDDNGLQTVPILQTNVTFEDWTIEKFLEFAEGEYHPGQPREGLVIRSMNEVYSQALRGRLSFKVISNSWLLSKKGEQ